MLVKYANAEITGVKGAADRLGRSASLSKFADYEDFRTDDGYIYVRVRAISSRVNKNHDGWPSEELSKSYKTFLGKPIFIDHNNHDPERARGVVVDAQLHVDDDKTSALDPYYSYAPKEHLPPTWIELLLETDAKSFPKLAKAVINGDIDGVSMGCNVERSKCSHCGNWATNPDEYCQHIRNKGAEFDYYRNGQKTAKKSYEDCYDIGFFEISYVFDPADETALFLEKPRTSSFEKTACSCGCGEGKCGDPDGCKCGSDCSVCGHKESKEHWIQDAVKKPGQLHKDLGVPEGEDIPEDKLEEAEHSKSKKVRERAQFAENMKKIKKGSYLQARMERLADTNQIPQSEMTVAPEKVDTLRQEQVCPICGSMMEDGICEVCNYEEPPEGFGNPDLTKAQDTDDMQQQQGLEAEDAQQDSMAVQNAQQQGQGMPQQPGSPPQPGMPMAASYISDTTNIITSERYAADLSGGRVNTKEKPLLPGTRQTTDKPRAQKTVSDSVKPVESSYTGELMSDTTKTADNAAEELANGSRVSPEAVGGVDGNENPDGHKTVSVDGVGAVDNDENPAGHQQVDLLGGLLNEVGPHTDTWSGLKGDGDSAGQASPVSSGGDHTLGKRLEILSADTVEGDLVSAGGKVMDLDAGLKNEVGGPTDTWSTADSFHSTDPVTTQAFPTEGEVTSDGGVDPTGEPFPSTEEGVSSDGGVNPGKSAFPASDEGVKSSRAAYRSHMITAMKLAETEIALGITPEDDKYDRIAELEAESSESLAARLDTVSKVKTAGLAKKVVAAKRPTPSFQTQSSLRSEPEEQDVDVEAIFS